MAGIIVVCWLFFRGAKKLFVGRAARSVDTFEQDAVRLIAMVARIGFALAILVVLAIFLFLLLAMSR
jgi:hypothetical protein